MQILEELVKAPYCITLRVNIGEHCIKHIIENKNDHDIVVNKIHLLRSIDKVHYHLTCCFGDYGYSFNIREGLFYNGVSDENIFYKFFDIPNSHRNLIEKTLGWKFIFAWILIITGREQSNYQEQYGSDYVFIDNVIEKMSSIKWE
jgi:hypothetical protein